MMKGGASSFKLMGAKVVWDFEGKSEENKDDMGNADARRVKRNEDLMVDNFTSCIII